MSINFITNTLNYNYNIMPISNVNSYSPTIKRDIDKKIKLGF